MSAIWLEQPDRTGALIASTPAAQIKAIAFLLRSTNYPFGRSLSGIILPPLGRLSPETIWADDDFAWLSIARNMSEARMHIATQHAEIEISVNSRIIDLVR
ncbi:MAG: hypothetical protein WA702_16140 [Bradyrhizobium sp.]|jgi:hypothetical protein|uniref:hypothetical protein n=1 Tax=Bradyrhizobium sp. TaxID=376 RepID=UPI003C7C2350